MKSVTNNKRICGRQRGRYVSGFTLIELMLVMVILATMAAIVLPKFTGRAKQAKITAAKTQIAQFEVALGASGVDSGAQPAVDEAPLAQHRTDGFELGAVQ